MVCERERERERWENLSFKLQSPFERGNMLGPYCNGEALSRNMPASVGYRIGARRPRRGRGNGSLPRPDGSRFMSS